MEFLINMSKIEPEFKLRGIMADSLFDAVMKITTLVMTFCAEDSFNFKVRHTHVSAHLLQFSLSFDKRKVNFLVYDPKVYRDAPSAMRRAAMR